MTKAHLGKASIKKLLKVSFFLLTPFLTKYSVDRALEFVLERNSIRCRVLLTKSKNTEIINKFLHPGLDLLGSTFNFKSRNKTLRYFEIYI